MSKTTSATRLVVIGGGPGGYPAAFLAADLGMDVTLVDSDERPGGVCLHRGCIPSKALLHVARFINEAAECSQWGIHLPPPEINLDELRAWKNSVVDRLTRGLAAGRDRRAIRFIRGRGKLDGPGTVAVVSPGGERQRIACDYVILATGSTPARLPFMPDDPRVMDSTAALELRDVPARLLVIGGGYIGLELGSAYASLGSRVTLVEKAPVMLPGVDRDLVDFLGRRLIPRLAGYLLDTKVVAVTAGAEGLRIQWAGLHVEHAEALFDKVLVAVGRRPLSSNLGLETTKVTIDPAGFIRTDRHRRTDEPTVFAVGDVAGEPMLAHKATYEARIAVETIAGQPAAFEPAAIPAVVFTDPELAWAGLTEEQARSQRRPYKIARFPWAASGRAATLGRCDGLTKLVLDPITERVLGVGIVGLGAGELIAEGVLAVEMGARASDLMMTIHAHPTLAETVMEAAEVYLGQSPHVVSDAPPRDRATFPPLAAPSAGVLLSPPPDRRSDGSARDRMD